MTWSTTSLLLAFAAFVGIVIFVMRVPASRWKKDANIPLDHPNPVDGKEKKDHE